MISISDVQSAMQALSAVVMRTPVLESVALNKEIGGRLLLKAEALQFTGSFKFRGAYNALSSLSDAQRERGVVAFSSGNFAQGLAAAGAMLRIPVTIVMPDDAPTQKVEATRRYGARVVLSAAGDENREVAAGRLAERLAEEEGLVLLHPFDRWPVIAGQATVAMELFDELVGRDITLDALLVPVGGGGLLGGACLVAKERSPGTRVYAVEPEGYDDMARSIASNRRERNSDQRPTICDALQAAMPGELTFQAVSQNVAGGHCVSDDDVRRAMRVAFEHFKLVLEPSGATALAAVLAGKVDVKGRTVCAYASGGNIDLSRFTELLH